MIKTITKIGNSHGLLFDAALVELSQMKVGDLVNIEVHEGGTLTVTPVRKVVGPKRAAKITKRLRT